jgi:hypothetical protein
VKLEPGGGMPSTATIEPGRYCPGIVKVEPGEDSSIRECDSLSLGSQPGLSARGEPSWINAPAASRDIDGKVREWLRKTASAVQVYLALVLQRFRGFSAYLCTLCLTCASPSQSGTASPGMSRRAREIAARHKSKKRDKEQQRQDVRAQQLVDLHTRFLQASSFAPHVVLVLDLIFFRFTFVPP